MTPLCASFTTLTDIQKKRWITVILYRKHSQLDTEITFRVARAHGGLIRATGSQALPSAIAVPIGAGCGLLESAIDHGLMRGYRTKPNDLVPESRQSFGFRRFRVAMWTGRFLSVLNGSLGWF